jgi:hypothetical protein
VSIAVRNPPGNIEPSPRPSAARATANPRNVEISAWLALDTAHSAIESAMPMRSPMRSSTGPQMSVDTMYA